MSMRDDLLKYAEEKGADGCTVNAMLDHVESEARVGDRPSRLFTKPAEIAAYLRRIFAEDVLLAYEQSVGARAVAEAAEDIRVHPGPIADRHSSGYWWDSRDRDAAADLIDPAQSGGPYPSNLGETT